nr:rna-binding protein mrn1 [Quercus suber]
MAATFEQVTVDKAYFDALLRRAPAQRGGPDVPATSWADDCPPVLPLPPHVKRQYEVHTGPPNHHMQRHGRASSSQLHFNRDAPMSWRNPRPDNEVSKSGDDTGFEDGDGEGTDGDTAGFTHIAGTRTLYLCGCPDGTTYEDIVSVIKGGKILNINMRSERSATVTLYDGAAEVLAWAKRNGLYIRSKRVRDIYFTDMAHADRYKIDVRWAERQYKLTNHIAKKVVNGATRNIVIHSAQERGLTEPQIRADMEHIHNLVIIKVTLSKGTAIVSTNSVHNALFSRTCMLSRTTYKGCKIEFCPDECDVPLPARTLSSRAPAKTSAWKKDTVTNRFGLLDMDDHFENSEVEDPTSRHSDSDV